MRALGGSFDLQSAPGQGTTATLTLQMAAGAESKGLGAELSGSNAALKTQSSALQQNATVRILLVDDH
ncbi:MAG TPA: hypothetical protein VN039_02700, partial [Nitrospira sp.]|nr:hypothetical protein [Nitrospira sp.]